MKKKSKRKEKKRKGKIDVEQFDMNLSPFALPCSRISGEKVNRKVTTSVILQNLV